MAMAYRGRDFDGRTLNKSSRAGQRFLTDRMRATRQPTRGLDHGRGEPIMKLVLAMGCRLAATGLPGG
jgi:hypothetical protein